MMTGNVTGRSTSMLYNYDIRYVDRFTEYIITIIDAISLFLLKPSIRT